MKRWASTALLWTVGLFCIALPPLRAQLPPPVTPSENVDQQEGTADPPSPFIIVVHRDNPTQQLTAKALSRIFLKRTKRWDKDIWPDEVRIVPMDLNEKSEIRKKLTRAVHDKSTGAIKSYWQREIFSGRDVPPAEFDSDEEMIKAIVGEKGAIGYVSGTAELPDELKVLEVVDE